MENSNLKLLDYAFLGFLIFAFLSERSILGNLSLVILFITTAIMVLKKNLLKLNLYFFFEFLFLLYCLGQNILGIPLYEDVAESRWITLFICFIFEIALYNYMFHKQNFRSIAILIVKGFGISLAIGIIINFNSLLAGLRGLDSSGVIIAGIPIGQVNSVGIAWVAGIGLVFSAVYYSTKNKRLLYFYSGLFSVAILLSGTRKAIGFIFVAYFVTKLMRENDRNEILKILKNLFKAGIMALFFLLLVLKVPFFYDLIGNRLESIFIYLNTGEGADDSFITRINLANIAWDAIKQKPYFGWGLDNFKYVFYQEKYYTHNNFLEIAVSTGVVGFFLFYIKYVYLFISMLKKRKTSIGDDKKISTALIIIFIAFVILEYWQVTYFSRKSLIIYVFILAYASKPLSKKSLEIKE